MVEGGAGFKERWTRTSSRPQRNWQRTWQTRVGEKEAEIMQGHMMLLADPMLTGEIENSIRNDGVNSEYASLRMCNMHAGYVSLQGRRADAAESHGYARH